MERMRTQSTTPTTPVTPAHRELGCTLVPTSSAISICSRKWVIPWCGIRPPLRSSSSKKIPSDTTQCHKYLKTVLFFSTYNNLQAKGKKKSSCINCSLSTTLHLSEKSNQHLQLLHQQWQYHPGHASSNLLHASLQLINIAIQQLLLWIETCS